jgi:hypothetical protein
LKRVEKTVTITAAVSEATVGFTVPTGAMVVSTACKITDALTGAGGADRIGMGTGSGGDPDKYCETATLGLNEADDNIHGTYNDGSEDVFWVTAENGAGSAGGTIASGEVQALIYFRDSVPV